MEDQLLERADKAIAESQRLKDQLYLVITKAKRLDEHLHYLHLAKIEETQRKKW